MDLLQPDFDITKLIQEAMNRWLKPVEVFYILQNHEKLKITSKTPDKPPGGTLFLFNRRVHRYFRNDGYTWRKKTNGRTVREGHERLKVGNFEALHCYYAHGEQNSCFQRRSYWMLNPAYDHIVLVHYREVAEGRRMPESILSIYSLCASNDQAQCFASQTTEFTEPQASSVGSAEEVSSKFVEQTMEMSHLNRIGESACSDQLPLPEIDQALRKIESLLSLDEEEDVFLPSKNDLLPFCGVNEETLANYEISNFQEETTQNQLDELKQMSVEFEDGTQCDIVLNNSDDVGWHSELPFIQCYPSEENNNGDIWNNEHIYLEAPLQSESSLTLAQGHLFTIHEVSPEWASSSERTKVLIIGDFLCDPSGFEWFALFEDIEVPLEIVRDGVFRCLAPQHSAGKVNLLITHGNRKCCSDVHEFEFREKFENNTSSVSPSLQLEATKGSEELLLLVNFVQLLLSGNSTSDTQDVEIEAEISLFSQLKGSKNQLDIIIESILAGSVPSGKIMDAILEELLKEKFQQWLSSRHSGDVDQAFLLSKQERCIIHTIAGLGYQWALLPLLNSGTCINYRDSNGWTALHWAASFGREEMVAALLASGASAGALTYPTSQDPVGKPAASLALVNGHKGLAGYLSEAALTSHLFSLTTEKNDILNATTPLEANKGVDNISERRAHLQDGTEDQLSLRDSLAAVRNATQAAARIQAAFRSHSFRKKQQNAALVQGTNDMSPADIQGLAVAAKSHKFSLGFHDQLLDKAAVSIQKNYRCWKGRKEFVRIRTSVVKIQTRVRAHLARKKYQELIWSVGILEKVILRWHRRGTGLRGFHSEPESIDEEEEDDINKVFRRQKVEKVVDEALSRVISVVRNPEARQQYRRMLESYEQAKAELSQASVDNVKQLQNYDYLAYNV